MPRASHILSAAERLFARRSCDNSLYDFARIGMNLGPRANKRPGVCNELRRYTTFIRDPYPFKAIFGPRKTLKTTIMRAAHVETFTNNHNRSILLGSHELDLASESLKDVAAHLTGRAKGSRVAHIYGRVELTPDRGDYFTISDHTAPLAKNSMNIFSVKESPTGGHWDELWLDNFQSRDNSRTMDLIAGVRDSYSGAIPLLTQAEDRAVFIMENIWHHADLGSSVMGEYREEAIRAQRPIMVKGEFGPFKVLAVPAGIRRSRRALDYETLNFPFNLPQQVLEEEYGQMPAAMYAAQYDLEAIADEEAIFHPDHYRVWDAQTIPKNLTVFIITDSAYRTKYHNDYSAFVVWGVGPDNVAYELDHFVGRVPIGDYVSRTLAAAAAYGAIKIGIEQTALAVALEEEFRRQMRVRSKHYAITALKHENKPKEDRAQAVQARYQNGGILFHPEKSAKGSSEMYKQIVDFPRGRHDDLVDCTTYLPQIVHWRSSSGPAKPAAGYDESRFWNDMLEEMDAEEDLPGFRVQGSDVRGGTFSRSEFF